MSIDSPNNPFPHPADTVPTPAPQPEAVVPPTNEAVSPPVPERAHTPEQIAEMRRNEVQTIVHSSVARVGFENVTSPLPVPTREAARSYYELANKVTRYADGPINPPFPLEGGVPLGFKHDVKSGKLVASASGQVAREITGKITKNGEVFFLCSVGSRSGVEIPASEMLNAQLLAEESNLIQAFPEGSAQRQVMEAHMAHLKDRKVEPQVSDTTIAEAARQSSLFTAESLRALVTRSTPDGSPIRESLLRELSDQIVANPETAGRVLASLDNSQDRIDGYTLGVKKNDAEIARLEAQIKAVPDETSAEAAQLNSHHRREIVQLKQQNALLEADRADLTTVQDALKEMGVTGDTGMIRLVAQLYNGQMSASQAERVNKACEQGNIDELVKSFMAEMPKSRLEELKKLHPKFIAGLEKWSKVGGSALGIFLALLLIQGMAAGER